MGFVINCKDLLSYLELCFPKLGRSNSCERLWDGWRGRISPTRATGLLLVPEECLSLQEPVWPYWFSLFYFFKDRFFLSGAFMA